jgi:hypothetical protein
LLQLYQEENRMEETKTNERKSRLQALLPYPQYVALQHALLDRGITVQEWVTQHVAAELVRQEALPHA